MKAVNPLSKCISRHGEYSEHQITDGVCDYCGAVEAITQEELKEIILEHAVTREMPASIVCASCGYLLQPKPGRQHWNVADHIAGIIMARLEKSNA